MELTVSKVLSSEISSFRTLFLQENNFQFIGNKCYEYGWATAYQFTINGIKVGYGAVWGTDRREDRDTIFEFYVLPTFRRFVNELFAKFCLVSEAIFIESQSNDALLSAMLYEYAEQINAEAILFEDQVTTTLAVPDVYFRSRTDDDQQDDDYSPYVLEKQGVIVASGGFMLNYNMPFADIYMTVKEPFRQQGLGAFLVQELKKEAYRVGRVPAARCVINNRASKATLQKAGFRVCGFRLKGTIKPLTD